MILLENPIMLLLESFQITLQATVGVGENNIDNRFSHEWLIDCQFWTGGR